MKAQIQKQKKKTLQSRIALSLTLALAFVALMGLLRSAEAKVVIRASVVTPAVRVQLSSGPALHARLQAGCVVIPPVEVIKDRRPRPRTRVIRNGRGVVRKLHNEDRRIARRLQRMTGIDKDLMLGYRRAGWTWPEIAFQLRIRRAQLAAAMNAHGRIGAGARMESCTYQVNHR
jgi:hypothetical protein